MKWLFAVVFLATGAIGASAQDELPACETLACPDGSAAFGSPGFCDCAQPEPEPEPEPVEPLTCERNFGCVDSGQIACGEWPECVCRDLEPPSPPGEGPLPDPTTPPGMGGVDTCKQFFTCLKGYEMLEWNGQCVCGAEMLPPPDP
jgi:hypothetical protein